ncbi:MAG: ATP-grasp domain-containing protein [Planctomycetales bacterium]|nr:ATP-grasp domain-containing protein [Planctomycetales bacterium]
MKVTVLEWICGGGLISTPVQQISESLRAEGWLMVDCLVHELLAASHDVTLILDGRLMSTHLETGVATRDRLQLHWLNDRCDTVEEVLNSWVQVAVHSELAIVVAPEIDGALTFAIESLSAAGISLLNCCGDFLHLASDKFDFARRLEKHQISHPPTYLLSDLGDSFSASLFAKNFQTRNCIVKPRNGAGCDGSLIANTEMIDSLCRSNRLPDNLANWIVQPWIEGQAMSCSCIVDRHGVSHWGPLVTQELCSKPDSTDNWPEQGNLQYLGGRVIGALPQALHGHLEKLMAALGPRALGWVGIDIVQSSDGTCWVMEVNPRLTTSVIGLSQATKHRGWLGDSLIRAAEGKPLHTFDWTKAQVTFSVAANH